MFGLELKTFDREAAGLDSPFVRSYLAMRFRIGLVAFALPWVLIVIDWLLITNQRQIRGSMSAYYHSPARDVFVGGLFVTGAFLVSYLRAKRKTYDYWLSTIAGLALIVVALVPTGRALSAPGFTVNGESCVEFPGPPDCNGFQKALDESTARLVHGIAASVFVLLLAALCFVFALREFGFGQAARKLCADPDVGYELGPTYVGEVVAFSAFGVAWMVSGKDLKPFGKVADLLGDAVSKVTHPSAANT
jgi:hypothetical protein